MGFLGSKPVALANGLKESLVKAKAAELVDRVLEPTVLTDLSSVLTDVLATGVPPGAIYVFGNNRAWLVFRQ